MSLFHVIDDAAAVLRTKGVFKQVKVFYRDNRLYAQHGGGFIGLRRDGGTTHPQVAWDYIEGVKWTVVDRGTGALELSEALRITKAA
jgi:hypothetical protein